MTASAPGGISRFAMDERALRPNGGNVVAAQTESRLRLLIETGLLLASERSLDVIVQAALDAGLKLCGAAFGAFFYNAGGMEGEAYQLYKLSGIEPLRFSAFPMPRPTAVFDPTFRGEAIVRCDDITQDPRYGKNAPLRGMPEGHVPVRSYLAVPVRSRGGEVLGALLYGHPEPGVFHQDIESLVATVAAQAAVAIDNARLTTTLQREIAVGDAARADQRATSQRLTQALEAAQLGTWRWNAATDMLDFDERAAALYGVPPGVPIPRRKLRDQTINREDLSLVPEDLRPLLKGSGQYVAEYRIGMPDGTLRWIAAHGTATVSEITGRLTGMIGTVQDITARKLQEDTLRTSEKLAATGRLAATIAHEINNPLEAVTNLIFLAKTDPAVPSSIARLLETADSELARVAQIAQQTLGFYRDTTRPVPIDINDLLREVVDLFASKLTGKRLRCTLELDAGLSVVGLQGEIRQVISNLLVNAIDASPASGGIIRIRGRRRSFRQRRGVSVLICDQGSGISAGLRKRIFTPFVTTKQSTGTGLGLWVTRGMVEKHGGSIAFRSSTEPPCGTVFRVYLPETCSPSLFASPSSPVLQ